MRAVSMLGVLGLLVFDCSVVPWCQDSSTILRTSALECQRETRPATQLFQHQDLQLASEQRQAAAV